MTQEFLLPKLLRREGQIDRILQAIMALSNEHAYRVEIHEQKPKRSDSQNRYLWGVCYASLLQVLPGWDADDVHDYMLGECFGWEVMEGLGRKRMRPIRRSSKLNKQEFTDFVDFIHRRAAQYGVVIPDADPDWFLKDVAA